MNTKFKLFMKSGNIIIIELCDDDNKIDGSKFLGKYASSSKNVCNWYLSKDNKLILINQIEAIEIIGD
jgi:hypothetical protein